MNNMDSNNSNNKKRQQISNDDGLLQKRHKSGKSHIFLSQEETPNPEIDDWKLTMGVTLADHLETIATEKKLTILQVKRLLKDVLTHSDVVAAFRQYMSGQLTLLEPETGEPSFSTRRRASILGLDPNALNRGGINSLEDLISSRVLTRSVATKIRHKINKDAQQKNGNLMEKPAPTTLLEMNFSDSEDTNDETLTPPTTVTGRHQQSATLPDEDYFPTAADLEMLERDLAYDRCDNTLVADNNEEDDDEEDDFVDVVSLRSGAVSPRDYCLRSRKDGLFLSPGVSLNTSLWEEDEYEEEGCIKQTALIQKNNRNQVVESATKQDDPCLAQDNADEKEQEKTEPAQSNDPAEKIYSNFLRSLFSPAPHRSYSEDGDHGWSKSELEFGAKSLLMGHREGITDTADSGNHDDATMPDVLAADSLSLHEQTATPLEDFDDPDFDVMAELDDELCCEDLFDELRTDRAVRVSKMEAKELRRDLTELFVDDDEEEEEQNSDPSLLPLATETHKHTGFSFQQEPEFPPLPPPPFQRSVNDRLKRQISMHLQMLASNYLGSVNRVDLEESICPLICQQAEELYSAFKEARVKGSLSYLTNLGELAMQFHATRHFLTEFGGVNMLPRITKQDELGTLPIPLPFFLLDFVIRSSVWPHPIILPTCLPGNPENSGSRSHVPFTAAEDGLIVLGIANYMEAHPKRFSQNFPDASSVPNKRACRNFFKFISDNLLPTRSFHQVCMRRTYVMLAARKQRFEGLSSRRRASDHSPMLLLMQDFSSPEFPDFASKRELLRASVPIFAGSLPTSQLITWGIRGSIFSRPEVLWRRMPLPGAYKACLNLLKLHQIRQKSASCPQPALWVLQEPYRSCKTVCQFFLEAMLTWWPASIEDEDEDDDVIDYSDMDPQPPAIPMKLFVLGPSPPGFPVISCKPLNRPSSDRNSVLSPKRPRRPLNAKLPIPRFAVYNGSQVCPPTCITSAIDEIQTQEPSVSEESVMPANKSVETTLPKPASKSPDKLVTNPSPKRVNPPVEMLPMPINESVVSKANEMHTFLQDNRYSALQVSVLPQTIFEIPLAALTIAAPIKSPVKIIPKALPKLPIPRLVPRDAHISHPSPLTVSSLQPPSSQVGEIETYLDESVLEQDKSSTVRMTNTPTSSHSPVVSSTTTTTAGLIQSPNDSPFTSPKPVTSMEKLPMQLLIPKCEPPSEHVEIQTHSILPEEKETSDAQVSVSSMCAISNIKNFVSFFLNTQIKSPSKNCFVSSHGATPFESNQLVPSSNNLPLANPIPSTICNSQQSDKIPIRLKETRNQTIVAASLSGKSKKMRRPRKSQTLKPAENKTLPGQTERVKSKSSQVQNDNKNRIDPVSILPTSNKTSLAVVSLTNAQSPFQYLNPSPIKSSSILSPALRNLPVPHLVKWQAATIQTSTTPILSLPNAPFSQMSAITDTGKPTVVTSPVQYTGDMCQTKSFRKSRKPKVKRKNQTPDLGQPSLHVQPAKPNKTIIPRWLPAPGRVPIQRIANFNTSMAQSLLTPTKEPNSGEENLAISTIISQDSTAEPSSKMIAASTNDVNSTSELVYDIKSSNLQNPKQKVITVPVIVSPANSPLYNSSETDQFSKIVPPSELESEDIKPFYLQNLAPSTSEPGNNQFPISLPSTSRKCILSRTKLSVCMVSPATNDNQNRDSSPERPITPEIVRLPSMISKSTFAQLNSLQKIQVDDINSSSEDIKPICLNSLISTTSELASTSSNGTLTPAQLHISLTTSPLNSTISPIQCSNQNFSLLSTDIQKNISLLEETLMSSVLSTSSVNQLPNCLELNPSGTKPRYQQNETALSSPKTNPTSPPPISLSNPEPVILLSNSTASLANVKDLPNGIPANPSESLLTPAAVRTFARMSSDSNSPDSPEALTSNKFFSSPLLNPPPIAKISSSSIRPTTPNKAAHVHKLPRLAPKGVISTNVSMFQSVTAISSKRKRLPARSKTSLKQVTDEISLSAAPTSLASTIEDGSSNSNQISVTIPSPPFPGIMVGSSQWITPPFGKLPIQRITPPTPLRPIFRRKLTPVGPRQSPPVTERKKTGHQ